MWSFSFRARSPFSVPTLFFSFLLCAEESDKLESIIRGRMGPKTDDLVFVHNIASELRSADLRAFFSEV